MREPIFSKTRRLPHDPLPASLHFLPPTGNEHRPVRLFVEERLELVSALSSCREQLEPGTEVWVSWPQRDSRLPTNITEAMVREAASRLGFVNVRACTPGEVWSLLKMELASERREALASPHGRSLTLVEELRQRRGP